MRSISKVAPEWWDYTTLDGEILADAARLTADDLLRLSRLGFQVRIYDTEEELYTAEASEYVQAWQRATPDAPAGLCGPVGPTRQLKLVAQMVNELEIDLGNAHFWASAEWVIEGREVPQAFPLSRTGANRRLCFDKIDERFRMPEENLHFLNVDNLTDYSLSYDSVRCLLMQGSQGEAKSWALNDPVRREGEYEEAPPSPEEYRRLGTREVGLHPMTLIQNARTSAGGLLPSIPNRAVTVGPYETWKAERVSIWHDGVHDNPFGMRLTALMISKQILDSSVPISLLADHPDVLFNYLRPAIGTCVPGVR